MREQPGGGVRGGGRATRAGSKHLVSQRPCPRLGEEMVSRPLWLQETFCLGRPGEAESHPAWRRGWERPRYRYSGVWR